MEDLDGGLHPAVDGQSLDKDEVNLVREPGGLPVQRTLNSSMVSNCPELNLTCFPDSHWDALGF